MAELVAAMAIIGAPCRPDRDRRDKSGDDEPAATGFALVTADNQGSSPRLRRGGSSS